MRIVKLNPNPQHHENFHLVYRRPLQPLGPSKWEFMGYRCVKCDRTVQNDSTVIKHGLNCKPREKKLRDEEPLMILDSKGESWTPFEINQEKILPETIENNNDKYNIIMDNTNGPT